MIKLFLVRHGLTELNKLKVYYGHTDCELLDEGIDQGRKIGSLLSEVTFDAIYASPLKRATKTANLVVGGQNIIKDDRLKELNFGACEGMTYKEIAKNHSTVWTNWSKDWVNTIMPDGESFAQLYERVGAFLNELKDSKINGNVLIVSHQGCLRSAVAYLLAMSAKGSWNFDFEQDAYSLIELGEDFTIVRKINSREPYK